MRLLGAAVVLTGEYFGRIARGGLDVRREMAVREARDLKEKSACLKLLHSNQGAKW